MLVDFNSSIKIIDCLFLAYSGSSSEYGPCPEECQNTVTILLSSIFGGGALICIICCIVDECWFRSKKRKESSTQDITT